MVLKGGPFSAKATEPRKTAVGSGAATLESRQSESTGESNGSTELHDRPNRCKPS